MNKKYLLIFMHRGFKSRESVEKIEALKKLLKNMLVLCFPIIISPSGSDGVRIFCKQIMNASIIVADLSYERQSVYFELGMAIGLGKKVLIIAKTGTQIHQCQNPSDIIFFDDLGQYIEILKRQLERMLKD